MRLPEATRPPPGRGSGSRLRQPPPAGLRTASILRLPVARPLTSPGHRFGKEAGERAQTRGVQPVSSNIAQNYPYSSETESERAATVASSIARTGGLADKVEAESIGLPGETRWWVWKCANRGCPGLLHAAGYARNARAVYTICDTCGKTSLR